MKIIVTGATGYLGGKVCARLHELGHEVHATGRNPDKVPRDIKFTSCSLEELSETPGFSGEYDAVVHCAALSASWGKRQEFYQHNVAGTECVLKLMQKLQITKLIHISSPSIMASLRDQLMLKETAPPPTCFLNYYAESKYQAERVIEQADGIERVILRPQAVIGSGDSTLVPRLITANLTTGIPTFKNKSPVIDVTHVDNVVEAIICALNTKPPNPFSIYNITNDEPALLTDLLRELMQRVNIPLRMKQTPYPVAKAVAYGWNGIANTFNLSEPRLTPYTLSILAHSRTLDIAKARNELHYQPIVPLSNALDDAAEGWFSRQKTL